MKRMPALLRRFGTAGHSKGSASPQRRFQSISDLHLEITSHGEPQQYETFSFPATAPYLILAGDIGRLIDYEGYLAFLRNQTTTYQRVFLVLGNHEFYGMSFSEGVEAARRLEKKPSLAERLTLLHQGRYEIEAIARAVSDFRQVSGWTTETHCGEHAKDLAWLRAEVERIRREDEGKRVPRQIVIVMHHSPRRLGTASPRHADSPYQTAFATDLCHGPEWSPVKSWIFGHTHWTVQIMTGNHVHIVSNQRGYVFPGQRRQIDGGPDELPPKHTFDPSRCIQI